MVGAHKTTQITREYGKLPVYKGHITVKIDTRLYAFNANDFLYSLAYKFVCYTQNMSPEEFGRRADMTADDFHFISGDAKMRGRHYDMEGGLYQPATDPEHFYSTDAAYFVMEHVSHGRAELVGLGAAMFYQFMSEATVQMARVFSDFVGELSMTEASSHQLAKNAETQVHKVQDQMMLKDRRMKQLEQELADHKSALAKVHEVFISAGNKDEVFVSANAS